MNEEMRLKSFTKILKNKNMQRFLLIVLIYLNINIYSQEKKQTLSRDVFEGVWEEVRVDNAYILLNESYHVDIFIEDNDDVTIYFYKYGFISEADYEKYKWNNEECLPVSKIRNKGKNMVVYLKEDYPTNKCLEGALFYGLSVDEDEGYMPGFITLEYRTLLEYSRAGPFNKEIEDVIIKALSKKGLNMPRTYVYNDWDNYCIVDSFKLTKVYLYTKTKTATKSYFLSGDALKILEEEKDWLYVEYWGGKKKTKGWIKKSNVEIKRNSK